MSKGVTYTLLYKKYLLIYFLYVLIFNNVKRCKN